VGDQLLAVGDISVSHATMGQVWDMLSGTLGKERKLTIERAGKQFTVVAKVQHFLGANPEEEGTKKKSKRD
jgi:C-terminal processing protease CtpA/Prc